MTEATNPSQLRVGKDKDRLSIAFGPDKTYEFTAEFLRVQSPSAEVRGHSEAERKTVGGKRNVRIVSVTPVGNYAVRIEFDDGHSSGIFSWDFFHDNGRNKDAIWAAYLAELAAKGMDRDTPQMR
ncbi:FIG028220: hypothetical protein co-occurring with HEAT repeat protein [hydrothermal vent metagenome]|uniref:Gamma-butyrobetaine hydroxylase-like N-terminal domain-containing protein n=1 Tax=hydrothermal vent metagenome TaxID=652676 RepID=A0A3B0T6W7_9ZZZZ